MKKYHVILPKMLAVLVLIAMPLAGWGCARDTVREERVVSPAGATSTTTVIREERVVEENPTVLGTIFNVVGEVIALPFRLVAGIFRFIF
jgi:hypothetical protein